LAAPTLSLNQEIAITVMPPSGPHLRMAPNFVPVLVGDKRGSKWGFRMPLIFSCGYTNPYNIRK